MLSCEASRTLKRRKVRNCLSVTVFFSKVDCREMLVCKQKLCITTKNNDFTLLLFVKVVLRYYKMLTPINLPYLEFCLYYARQSVAKGNRREQLPNNL